MDGNPVATTVYDPGLAATALSVVQEDGAGTLAVSGSWNSSGSWKKIEKQHSILLLYKAEEMRGKSTYYRELA